MIKRSLFIRIFGWFWACMTLVVAANLVVLLMNEPEELKAAHRARTARLLAVLAEGESLDSPGGAAWPEKVKQAMGMEVFVFDATGRAALRGTPPASATDVASRAAATGKVAHLDVSVGYWLAVPGTASADGSHRIAVGLVRMPPPPSSIEIFLGRGPVVPRLITMFLLSGILSLLLARSLSAPLRKLKDTTRQLAAGDLSARVPPGTRERGDEIADLAGDVNLMAERLEEAMSSHRRLLTDISHELRSPLARLCVALELARTRTGDQAGRALDRIETETGRMNILIGQILSLSRLEIGEPRRNLVELDLGALVERIVRDANFEAHAANRSVEPDGERALMVSGNEELLSRAVENVVRNAVRHTPEGSKVTVSLGREGDAVLIGVRDRGPGVPAEALGKIFQPFYRVESGRERDTGGTGLGLAISERAVRLHGGNITARNHDEGGLVVEIRLPAPHP